MGLRHLHGREYQQGAGMDSRLLPPLATSVTEQLWSRARSRRSTKQGTSVNMASAALGSRAQKSTKKKKPQKKLVKIPQTDFSKATRPQRAPSARLGLTRDNPQAPILLSQNGPAAPSRLLGGCGNTPGSAFFFCPRSQTDLQQLMKTPKFPGRCSRTQSAEFPALPPSLSSLSLSVLNLKKPPGGESGGTKVSLQTPAAIARS